MTTQHTLFATAPKGLELLLRDELLALGADTAAEKRAGVVFTGTLETAYKACLWSRFANRILLPLATFSAPDPDALYAGIYAIDWNTHFSVNNTIAVDFNSQQSVITHTQYGAQKVKDAIVDQFRDRFQERPSVDREQPDIQLNVYVLRDEATVSLDLSGASLHKRGYRLDAGFAPLKENLAAAILARAGWPSIAQNGGTLLDPLCGAGTLLIEAALIAGDIAPGLFHTHFGFLAWRSHDAHCWSKLCDEAEERRAAGYKKIPTIVGYDADPLAIKNAIQNIERANLQTYIHVEKRELAQCTLTEKLRANPGLVVVNPPYGERLGEEEELVYLYQHFGQLLKTQFENWHAAIFTGNPDLGKRMGLRAKKIYSLFNGAIPCQLLNFHVTPEWFVSEKKRAPAIVNSHEEKTMSAGAQMFSNRLQKNIKHLRRWAEREAVHCYRVYDADLPEYAVAIDRYEAWVQVYEYAAPKTIDPEKAALRLQEICDVLPQVLAIPASHVFLKTRTRQRGSAQYTRQDTTDHFEIVREGDAKFLVNFTDYLDTGLFLDQRLTRAFLREQAKGKHFLNLFAYTGTATIAAALGGAKTTTTVDLSAQYIRWARRNLALNGFSDQRHTFIQADCLQWLSEEEQRYDLIFLDPPTFSNSKRMEATLDIQRDHVALIQSTMRLLAPGGLLVFCNNKRGFKMDRDALSRYALEDFTAATIPPDFSRDPGVHCCWKIRLNAS